MLDGQKSLKSPHKVVVLENVHQNALYTITQGEKVSKLVNLAQIVTCRPLKRTIIHSDRLDGPKSPQSLHKLVLPENVSLSDFYTVILGEIGSKSGKTGQFYPNLDQ